MLIALEIQRVRTPPYVMLYATYLYLAGLAFSLRRVTEALHVLGVERGHEAVRQRVQRFGEAARECLEAGEAATAVVDETQIKVGDQWLWLWIAIPPERCKILAMAVSRLRNGLVARSMLKDLRRRYGRIRVTDADGGPWYPRAARSLGMEHEVMSGGIRNYVERLIETNHGRDQELRRLLPMQVRQSNAHVELPPLIRGLLQPRQTPPGTRRTTGPCQGRHGIPTTMQHP